MINQQIVKDYFNDDDYVVTIYYFENKKLYCDILDEEKDIYLNQLYKAYYKLLSLGLIADCSYSINSYAYLKYLNHRLKYDDNKRDARQELEKQIVNEDVINVIREFRDGNL